MVVVVAFIFVFVVVVVAVVFIVLSGICLRKSLNLRVSQYVSNSLGASAFTNLLPHDQTIVVFFYTQTRLSAFSDSTLWTVFIYGFSMSSELLSPSTFSICWNNTFSVVSATLFGGVKMVARILKVF